MLEVLDGVLQLTNPFELALKFLHSVQTIRLSLDLVLPIIKYSLKK